MSFLMSLLLLGLITGCGDGRGSAGGRILSTAVAAALTATAQSVPAVTTAVAAPAATAFVGRPSPVAAKPTKEKPLSAATTPSVPAQDMPPDTTETALPQMTVAETTAYQLLPQKVLVAPALVIATPLQPASYLDAPPIAKGETVRVVARDNDGSFLLVLYDGKLNWISAIAAGFVGNLDVPVISEAPKTNCASFLGAARAPGEAWHNPAGGALAVRSLVYRPQPLGNAPVLSVLESGQKLEPTAKHPLTAGGGEVVEFSGQLYDTPADLPITLQPVGMESEPSVFQAVFLTDDCSMAAETLAVAPAQASAVVSTGPVPVWTDPGDSKNTVIGQLEEGDTLALTGASNDSGGRQWWRILLPAGEVGWVEESGVEESGCLECVPVVPRTIVLKIASQVSSISRFILIDAERDVPITDLPSGSSIRLSDLRTTRLDVEAIAPDAHTESVLFYLDGQLFCANSRCLENGPPYAMAGDLNQGDHYDNWDWSNMLGRHTISAVGCDQDNGQGNCGAPLTVEFTVRR
jgi:hypothetical protein